MLACRTNGRDATERIARLWRNIVGVVGRKQVVSNDYLRHKHAKATNVCDDCVVLGQQRTMRIDDVIIHYFLLFTI